MNINATGPQGLGAPAAEAPAEAAARWLADAEGEWDRAWSNWRGGNTGKGRVGSRRAAGMGLKAWLSLQARPEYRTSFMHHLNALADDAEQPVAMRECAWRLSARPMPAAGFAVPIGNTLTPMDDARTLLAWCATEVVRLTSSPP